MEVRMGIGLSSRALGRAVDNCNQRRRSPVNFLQMQEERIA
jgi:hypothetical protein